MVYDTFLYTTKGLINYCGNDITNDCYVVDIMKPRRQSSTTEVQSADMIRLGCMVRRQNGSELLKIVKVTTNEATLELILPSSRQGQLVIEHDMDKLNNEINALFQ